MLSQRLQQLLKPVVRSAAKHMYILHAQCSRNNTLLTLADAKHRTLGWSSGGTIGLKKAARGTSDAAYQATTTLLKRFPNLGLVHLKLQGFGPGREQIFRACRASGSTLGRITDVTCIAHGGCRPRKKRRL